MTVVNAFLSGAVTGGFGVVMLFFVAWVMKERRRTPTSAPPVAFVPSTTHQLKTETRLQEEMEVFENLDPPSKAKAVEEKLERFR